MEAIWLVLTEIVAQTADPPTTSKVGFMNVTTWADCKEAAGTKIRQYLESFGWNLVSIEEANVVEDEGVYGEDVADREDAKQPEGHHSWNVSYIQDELMNLSSICHLNPCESVAGSNL